MNDAVARQILGENYIPKKNTTITDAVTEEVTIIFECPCGYHLEKRKYPPFTVRDRDCPDCGKMIIPYFRLSEEKNGKNE